MNIENFPSEISQSFTRRIALWGSFLSLLGNDFLDCECLILPSAEETIFINCVALGTYRGDILSN